MCHHCNWDDCTADCCGSEGCLSQPCPCLSQANPEEGTISHGSAVLFRSALLSICALDVFSLIPGFGLLAGAGLGVWLSYLLPPAIPFSWLANLLFFVLVMSLPPCVIGGIIHAFLKGHRERDGRGHAKMFCACPDVESPQVRESHNENKRLKREEAQLKEEIVLLKEEERDLQQLEKEIDNQKEKNKVINKRLVACQKEGSTIETSTQNILKRISEKKEEVEEAKQAENIQKQKLETLEQNIKKKQMEIEAMKPAREALSELLICSITQDRYKDPVTISIGHTYERAALTEWWKAKKNVRGDYPDPNTRQLIHDDPTKIPTDRIVHKFVLAVSKKI